jgi:transcriptional regulator of acetoin/glycerol metabolism
VDRGRAGTNAIGTALATDHAVQIFPAEHFPRALQVRWAAA